jgi:RNA polymerase sigma factor (sigma-70 family)
MQAGRCRRHFINFTCISSAVSVHCQVRIWHKRTCPKGLVQISIKSTIEAYLVGAVRHKVYDYYDKQSVRERHKAKVASMPPALVNSTEESLAYQELNLLVNLQVQQLPPITRQVFVSSRFGGSSIPEISEETSLSIKAVEYHLTKALRKLRLGLEQYRYRV